MNPAIRAPLVALAASIGLIAAYLAFGGATYDPAAVADPCEMRETSVLAERDLFETLALSSLDGAACELGVDREAVALALSDQAATEAFAAEEGISSADLEAAVRAGLVRAVDDASAAGKVDGLEEEILRQIAANAPVGATISALQALPGDDSVQSLLEQLGGLQDLELPGVDDLPSIDDLSGLEDLFGLEELDDLIP